MRHHFKTETAESNRAAGPRPVPDHPLTRVLAVFFGIFLLASAVSIAAAQIALGICVLIYASILVRQRALPSEPTLKPLFLVWAIYVLWLVLASLANDHPWRSLDCIREEWLLIILPIGLHLNRDRIVSRRLLLTLATGLIIVSLYGIVQHFTGLRFLTAQNLHSAGGNFRLSGSFSHPLTYGYFVVTATIFFLASVLTGFRDQKRVIRIVLTAASLLGLLASALCNSRGPMLALVIGLIFVGLLAGRLRWAVLGLGFVAVLALSFSPGLVDAFAQRVANDWHADNPAGRLFIWKQAGAIAADHPLLGCGPGNFGAAYAEQLPDEFAASGAKGHAHNDFIHQAAVAGFPAALLLLVLWGVVFRHFWRLLHNQSSTPQTKALAFGALAASVAFLAGSMTECAFADEELRQLIVALWAFAWIPTNNQF